MAGDGLLSRIEEIEQEAGKVSAPSRPESLSRPESDAAEPGGGGLLQRIEEIESGAESPSPGASDESSRARANLMLERSPEDATRALRLSRETGAPVAATARNPGVMERGLAVQGIAEVSQSAPQLHAVLAGDPVTARAVSDSLTPLTAWETVVNDMREFGRNVVTDPARRAGFGWIAQLGGLKQRVGEEAVTATPALTERLRPEYERLYAGLTPEQQEEVASRRAYNRAVLDEWRRLEATLERGQALADEGALQAELAQNLREFYAPPEDAPGWQVFLGEATESVVGNTLPTMLLGVGGGAIAGNVGRVLGGGAGLGGMFVQVYGDRYQQLRRDGYSATDADLHSTVYALTETIPEMMPLSIALAPGKVGLRNAVKRVLETAGAEGATEALTEVLQIGYESGVLGEDVGGLGEMVGRVLYAAALGATVGGGMGAIGAAAGLQQDRTVAQELERQLDIQRATATEQLTTAEQREMEVTERERARAAGEVELSQEQIGQLEADRAEADAALAAARERVAAIERRSAEGREAKDTQELVDIALVEARANEREALIEQERVASLIADATRDHIAYAQQQEALDSLIAIAEETPARLRDEELFLSVTDGSGLAYIDAQTLRSALTNPEAVEGMAEPVTLQTFFQLVPEAQAQFDEAARIGGDLVLPLNRVVSAMASNKGLRELVKESTRLTPEAMNTADYEGVLDSTVTPALRATADKTAIREKVSAFKRRIFGDVRRSGYSAKAASMYADTFAAFYRTQMMRLQGSPEALRRLDAMMAGLSVQSAARRDMLASAAEGVTLDQLRELEQRAQEQGTLVVQHNLSEANLLHAAKMGGLAAPSIAVAKGESPLESFGEITLIGSRDMADPRRDSSTRMFGADIYSPRYPSVAYEIPRSKHGEARAWVKAGEDATGERVQWDEVADKGANELKNAPAVMWEFLSGEGVEPEIVMTPAIPQEQLDALKAAGFEPFFGRSYLDLIRAQEFKDLALPYLVDLYEKADAPDLAERVRQSYAEAVEMVPFTMARDVAWEVQKAGEPQKVDPWRTRDALRMQIEDAGLREKFLDYVEDKFSSLEPTEKLFAGFTASGNRRYIPHTIENVIKALKKDLRGGEGFNYGVGSVRAKYTKQFKSISGIKAEEGRLVTKEQFDALKEEVDAEFFSIAEAVVADAGRKDFGAYDAVASAMMDAARMGLPRALSENGLDDVRPETQKRVAGFLMKLRDMPTEYFEGKLLRRVALAEFEGAVVPSDIGERALAALKESGIERIETYERGDQASRAAAVGKFSRSFFQGPADITDTPEFRAWFGESKVVDENGRPLVVHHSGSFDEESDGAFAASAAGIHFGSEWAAKIRVNGKVVDDMISDLTVEFIDNGDGESGYVWSSQGIDSFDIAEPFETEEEAREHALRIAENEAEMMVMNGDEPVITRAYLSLQNPKHVADAQTPEAWAEEIRKAREEGHDGLVYINRFEDAGSTSYVAFSPEQIKSVNNRGTFSRDDPRVLFQGPSMPEAFTPESVDGQREDGTHPGEISERNPTGARSTEDPLAEFLSVGVESTARLGDRFVQMATTLKTYPGFVTRKRNARAIVEDFVQFTTDNLLFLYDNVDPSWRERASHWYDGAREVTTRWAEKYGIPDIGIAGALAALSPQKDWFTNVSLAERVLDIHTRFTRGNWRGYIADAAQREKAFELYVERKGDKLSAEEVSAWNLRLDDIFSRPYESQDSDYDRAIWLRSFDELYNQRGFRVLTPEGEFVGEPRGKVAWGSNAEISKAIGMLSNPTREYVSQNISREHKVRNFFNNILAPMSPRGSVTIDTHAVAAALIRALAGGSTEVLHNFAGYVKPPGIPSMKSSVLGVSGTYGLYAEAYRRAAAARGILPRQMQSITWEAVRTLFPAEDKRGTLPDRIDAIWMRHQKGELRIDQARAEIVREAGGITAPEWTGGSDAGLVAASRDSSYEGELSESTVAGGSAEGGDVEVPAGGAGLREGAQGQEVAPSTRDRVAQARAVRQRALALRRGRTLYQSQIEREIASARAALQWTEHETSKGPLYEGLSVSLVPSGEDWGMGDQWRHLRVLDHESGKLVGDLVLAMRDGAPAGLHVLSFESEHQGRGLGQDVVEMLLANVPGSVDVVDILDESQGFWRRMGAYGYSEDARNARLSWDTYAAARLLPPRRRGERPAIAAGRAVDGGPDIGAQALVEPVSSPPADDRAGGEVLRLTLAAGNGETAAANRRADDPVAWIPREHFEVSAEPTDGQVEVDASTVYDMASDPLELRDDATDEADTTGAHPATVLERLILDNGFAGYRVGDVVAMFSDAPREAVGAATRDRQLGQRRDGPRGQIRFEGDRSVITVFEQHDFSTVLHEASHFFLEAMSVIAESPDAPAEFVRDYQTTLTWLGNRGEPLTVEQHEKFARGGEAYFLEGNAPSGALRRMFRVFRAWMERIYESAVALQVQLTPEVRGVFDRMLASSEEIDALRDSDAAGADPNFLSLLTPAERRAYLARREEQFERAKEHLLAKLVRQIRRERKQAWRDEREALRPQVEAEVNAQPVYQATHWLQTGKRLDGQESPLEPIKLDRAELVRDYHPEAVARLPRGVTAKSGGAATDVVAEWFGYSSGAELVAEMSAALPRRRLIEQRLDEMMRERHGDMLSDGSIQAEAEASLAAADRTGEVLYVLQVLARRAGKPAATREFYEAEVDRMLAGMPVGEVLDARRYRTAEVRAARKVGRHLARGNLELAAAAKREQLIQHILYRRSLEARDMVDKTRARFARYVRPQARGKTKVDEDYHRMVQRLVATVSMGPRMSDRTLARLTAESLSAWMAQRADADGTVFLDPPNMLDQPVHFKELSLEDFEAFVDVVDNVYAQGRMLRSVVIEGKRIEMAQVGEAISSSVRENVPERDQPFDTRTPAARRGQLARGFFYSLLKARAIMRRLDGGKLGPMHRFVMRAMDRAEVEKTRRMQQVAEDVDAIFKRHLGKGLRGMSSRMTYIPELRQSMSRASMIAVLLNLGNADNKTKLMEGRKVKGAEETWTQEHVDAVLRHLTKRDLAFANEVWAYIDSYWPEVAALERRTMGVTPAKVEAEPFEVTLASGETVQMRGGYYPLMYDNNVSPRAQDVAQESIADIMKRGRFASAQTQQGHTQARVSGVREPVRLDLGVLVQHLEQVVTDITMREATVNAYRILNRRDVADAIAQTLGVEAHQMLSIWAQDVAVGSVVAGGSIESILDGWRAGVSVATMCFKFSTMMAQITGFTHSVVRIGPMDMLRGLRAVMTGFGSAGYSSDRGLTVNANVRAVYEKSEFMRQRATTFHRDVRDAMRAMEKKGEIRGAIAKAGFWPIVKMQAVVDVVSWLGAYHRGLSLYPDNEAAAVEHADRMIVESQGSGYMKDLSGIERGSIGPQSRLRPAWRLWTTFYAYFNTKLNLAYSRAAETDFRKPRDVARLAVDYMLLFILEAVLAEVILGRAPDPDDEDDDGWLLWSAKLAASSALATIPVVSQISGSLQGFDAAPAGLRGLDTIARGVKESGEAVAALAMDDEELDVYQLVRAINGAGGVIFKYPAAQTNQVLRAMEQASEGEDVSLWDFLVYQEK